VSVRVQGALKVKFYDTGLEVSIEQPLLCIKGLMKGERYFSFEKEAFVYSETHFLFA
jgi:hypothetical protein